MKLVTCTLPNAALHISGVDFERSEAGVVATVGAEIAKRFEGIPGYTITDAEPADDGANQGDLLNQNVDAEVTGVAGADASDQSVAAEEGAAAEQQAAAETGNKRSRAKQGA